MRLGKFTDLSNEEYHADDAIGSSSLRVFVNKTPAHFKARVSVSKPEFDIGTAAHTAILEPERFQGAVVRGPEDRRGNKWKEAKEEAGDRLLLTQPDYDAVLAMADSVYKNPLAKELLSGATEAEASIFAMDDINDVRCKIRPDLYNQSGNFILDLKTTANAASEDFAKSVAAYGYHFQEAFYRRVWRMHHKKIVDNFYFLAVEKEPPYLCAVYQIDRHALQEGKLQVERALGLYAQAVKNDDWRGYPETIQPLSLPKYAYKMLNPDELPIFTNSQMG